MDAIYILNGGIFYAVSMYGIYYSQFKADRSYSGIEQAYVLHMLFWYQLHRCRATQTLATTDP